jgi:membrane fusion protein (multidrug efflux system)
LAPENESFDVEMPDLPANPGEAGQPAAPEEGSEGPRFRRPRRRWIGLAIVVIVLIAGSPFAMHFINYMRTHPSTDDAAVDGDLYPISARINGRALKVNVTDNDYVHAGQVLVELDPADIQTQLDQARADLAMETANLRAAGANIEVTQKTTGAAAGQATAGVSLARAQREAARHQVSVGQAQIMSAAAGVTAAQATVADTANSIDAARAGVTGSQAALMSAEEGIRSAEQSVVAAEAGVRAAQDNVSVASSDLTAAKAAAKKSDSDFRRARVLFSEEAIPQNQLDAAEADSTTADAHVVGAAKRETAAQAALDQARANLSSARSALSQAAARRDQARASVSQAQASYRSSNENVNVARARADQARAAELQYKRTIPQLEADVSQRGAGISQAQATLRGTESGPNQVQASVAQAGTVQARIQQAQARIDELSLQLSYTKVIAPHDGYISQKNVNVGQAISEGQPLMAVVDLVNIYVTANYKETQLHSMKVGNPAEFEVDTYPGIKFAGHVISLSPGTGSVFALLPPENATGNFTKIVQRVPIRIGIDSPPDPDHPLRLGMSVVPVVTTE